MFHGCRDAAFDQIDIYKESCTVMDQYVLGSVRQIVKAGSDGILTGHTAGHDYYIAGQLMLFHQRFCRIQVIFRNNKNDFVD